MAMDIASSLRASVINLQTPEGEGGVRSRVDEWTVTLQVLYDKLQEQFSPAGWPFVFVYIYTCVVDSQSSTG